MLAGLWQSREPSSSGGIVPHFVIIPIPYSVCGEPTTMPVGRVVNTDDRVRAAAAAVAAAMAAVVLHQVDSDEASRWAMMRLRRSLVTNKLRLHSLAKYDVPAEWNAGLSARRATMKPNILGATVKPWRRPAQPPGWIVVHAFLSEGSQR
jgi:hypothetical protein